MKRNPSRNRRLSTTARSLAAIAAMLLIITACGDGADDDGNGEAAASDDAEDAADDDGAGDDDGAEDDDGAAGDGDEAEGEEVYLRLAHVLPTSSVEHETLVELVDNIEERTDGRFTMDIFPGGELGSTTDVIEQAASGEEIIGFLDASYASTLGAEEMAILGGPFLFNDVAEGQAISESDLYQGWLDQLADEAGVRVLSLSWFDGHRHVIGNDPYPSPEDMEGVLVRSPPVDSWTTTFELIGAVPTTLENTEVYSGLQQGVVEAAESPLNGIASQQWQEVAKEITLTGHFMLFLGFATSEDVFQSLSPEDQELLLEEFAAAGERATERHAETTSETRAEFEEQGVNFHEADTDAYREVTAPFYDQFRDGLFEEVREAATN